MRVVRSLISKPAAAVAAFGALVCGHPYAAGWLMTAGTTAASQPSGRADWFAVESARSNVVVASRLDAQSIIDGWKVRDATADHISFDPSIVYPGSQGSSRHAVRNTDVAASGHLSVPFGLTASNPSGVSFGAGQKLAVAFTVYFDAQELFAPWPPGDDGSAKIAILSRDGNGGFGGGQDGSNQANEIVIQLNYNQGEVSGYWQGFYKGEGPYTALPFEANLTTDCQGGDFIGQPERDGGAKLAGKNPDDGSGWDACQHSRYRYGATHYSARGNNISTTNTRRGLGNPFSGGWRPTPGEWSYFQLGVEINAAGFGSGKDMAIVLMAAHEGGPWEVLYHAEAGDGVQPGAGPNYNGFNLLPYTTNRASGGRHVSARSGELASCFDIWNVAPTHAMGDGTLTWTARTGRLTWRAQGDSPGMPRGYSAANGFYNLNLISSTTLTNFINGRVAPDVCPGTDTSETVTIGDGRPDTQRNYGPIIVREGAFVNAPDGSAPPLTL